LPRSSTSTVRAGSASLAAGDAVIAESAASREQPVARRV
jgi:hypothetical protein